MATAKTDRIPGPSGAGDPRWVGHIYALLVGINAYPAPVSQLAGCLNDVAALHDWLSAQAGSALSARVLTDAQATRQAVIDGFRDHLGQAGAGDVALFHYCGHGARQTSNKAFRPYYPDGLDEGLVCFDSRLPGGHDLADKELAVLIGAAAARGAETVVILDCCHSGSGTRGLDELNGLRARLAPDIHAERPLESYLGGHYARSLAAGESLAPPAPRHILLAACTRGQTAKETPLGGGVFTSALVAVLRATGGDLSYADLFVRTRATVQAHADEQDPQFECLGRFDAAGGVLGRNVGRTPPRYAVAFADTGEWTAACGALNSVVATDAGTPVTMALFDEVDGKRAGTATVVSVGAQSSTLRLAFESPRAARYAAEITSLPAPPLELGCDDETARASLTDAFAGVVPPVPYILVPPSRATGFVLQTELTRPAIVDAATGHIVFMPGPAADAARLADMLAPALRHIGQFERARSLANPRSAIGADMLQICFGAQRPDGTWEDHDAEDVALDYTRGPDGWSAPRARVLVRNAGAQVLHVTLVYFSKQCGVIVLVGSEPVPPGAGWMTLWGDGESDVFTIADGEEAAIDWFKLIAATEPFDSFLLPLDDLPDIPSRDIGTVRPERKRPLVDAWCARDLRVRLRRQTDRIGPRQAVLGGGALVVVAHPGLSGGLTLSRPAAATRDAATPALHVALARAGFRLLDLSGTRDGDGKVLEISGITGADSLARTPLELRARAALGPGEALLPVLHDGEAFRMAGATEAVADGVRVTIGDLPAPVAQNRSVAGALKLFLFAVVLPVARINRLGWIETAPDGTVRVSTDALAEKVAAARAILVLVPGIVGDTREMAAALPALGGFDLVLAYDYENLSTPLQQTARNLKARLQAAGLGGERRATVIAHAAGGLVARWMIEQEDGGALVGRLVMCGTPNAGSPFGRIDEARAVVGTVLTWAMNHSPVQIPYIKDLLQVMSLTHRLTPTLEQLSPASELVRALSASPPPAVTYVALAGDVAAAHAEADPLLQRLLARVGRTEGYGLLFGLDPNDIVVSVASAHALPEAFAAVVRRKMACHHMNYFRAPASLAALAEACAASV